MPSDPPEQRPEPVGAEDVRPGDVLAGKYRVDRVIGAGGMGMVVQATHLALQDRVALKFLLPEFVQNESVAARFLREAQAAVRIKSPHVARVVDVGKLESGAPYMVMEYLDGSDLGCTLEAEGRLSPDQAVSFLLQACEALAAAHAGGIVHRDIKPANLFVTQAPDGSPMIKVLDFGISKVTGPSAVSTLTKTHTAMGSPMYMSPEQMRSARDVDFRADIWSLGVVLHEMLTGVLPFVAESMPQLVLLVLESPTPSARSVRPEIPEGLDAVVGKCLQKNVADRYQNVGELAQALAPFAGASGIESARRIVRILAGGSSPESRVLSQTARDSMVQLAQTAAAPSTPISTGTAFGRTDPKGGGGQKRVAMFAALGGGVAVIALGAAWLLMQGSTEVTSQPSTNATTVVPISSGEMVPAAGSASAHAPAASEPSASAVPPATSAPIDAAPLGSTASPPATRQPVKPKPGDGGSKKPGGSVYDDRQ